MQHFNEESEVESIDSDIKIPLSEKNDNDNFALKKQNAFWNKSMFLLQNTSIKSLLKKTIQGQSILQSYKKMKILSRKCRNVIVDLILSDILLKTNRLLLFNRIYLYFIYVSDMNYIFINKL